MLARPVHVGMLTDVEQQVEILFEQRIVVFQVQPKQRKGFDERTAANHHLRPSLGNQIQCREVLKHAYRVRCAEYCDGAGEANPLRARRRRGEDDSWRRVQELLAVMLSDPEHIEAHLVGILNPADKLPGRFRRLPNMARAGVSPSRDKTVDADFHGCSLLIRGRLKDPAKCGTEPDEHD